MILHCTEKELQELLIKQVVSLERKTDKDGKDEMCKVLNVKSILTDEIFKVVIDTSHQLDKSDLRFVDKRKEKDVIDYSVFTLNDWWQLFLNRVPMNIEHGKWTKDNINTGKRVLRAYKEAETIFKLNVEINDISVKTMLMAYAYDLYCHRVSSIDENQLKYMLSLDNWLSNTHRIEYLYKEACADEKFLEYYRQDPIRVEQDDTEYSPFTSLN